MQLPWALWYLAEYRNIYKITTYFIFRFSKIEGKLAFMSYFEIPLDIEGVKIEGVEFTKQDEIFISVTSTIEGTECHICVQKITNFYGQDREIVLRHLSILGKPTYIKIRPKRYRCLNCKERPTSTQRLPWYEPRSPQTRAYETHVLLSLVNSTVTDVSIKEGIGYEAVIGIINRYVSPEVDWNEFWLFGSSRFLQFTDNHANNSYPLRSIKSR
jgi:hypothetical protein